MAGIIFPERIRFREIKHCNSITQKGNKIEGCLGATPEV
jgi:hypothetical protein